MLAMSTGVQYSKSKKKKKLRKYYNGSFNKAEYNYPIIEREILVVIRGIEKFLIFLTLKPFLIRTDCK